MPSHRSKSRSRHSMKYNQSHRSRSRSTFCHLMQHRSRSRSTSRSCYSMRYNQKHSSSRSYNQKRSKRSQRSSSQRSKPLLIMSYSSVLKCSEPKLKEQISKPRPLPFPRFLPRRPSLVFTNPAAEENPAFLYDHQEIMRLFTSERNGKWRATGYMFETQKVRRDLVNLATVDIHPYNSLSYSASSPSYSPSNYSPSPSYKPIIGDNLTEFEDQLAHPSRCVSMLHCHFPAFSKIIIDVNECLAKVDLWVRNCEGMNIPDIANIILAYYNQWDSVALRAQNISEIVKVPKEFIWWFREASEQDCPRCADEFDSFSDCQRCNPTW